MYPALLYEYTFVSVFTLLCCLMNRLTVAEMVMSCDRLWQQQSRCHYVLFANCAGFFNQQVEFILMSMADSQLGYNDMIVIAL